MLDRAEDLRRALVGAEGEDPGHRQVGEAHGQREQRRGGPAVSPLQVVERDQERPVEGGALEQHLQVLQQPVALLGQRAKLRQPGSLEQRARAVEQRGHQRSELDDPRAGLSRASAHSEREPPRDPVRLGQEAGLAHTRLSLDEHHRPDTRAHAIKLNTDRREFSVPTANNGSAGGRQAQISESTSLAEARFAVARLRASGRAHRRTRRWRRRSSGLRGRKACAASAAEGGNAPPGAAARHPTIMRSLPPRGLTAVAMEDIA